jgi:hypothetical protein
MDGSDHAESVAGLLLDEMRRPSGVHIDVDDAAGRILEWAWTR